MKRKVFKPRGFFVACCLAALTAGLACATREERRAEESRGEIIVAAAASLTNAFDEVGRNFTGRTGIRVTFSFGATGDLAKQIENGAPFDAFASADVEHVEALAEKNLIVEDTRAVFARGRLVLWIPEGSRARIGRVEEVAGAQALKIAVAKPEIAPYGQAAVEAMRALGIWEQAEPRVVYSQNVAQAKQFAATGNADAAFLPRALVRDGEGLSVEIDEKLYASIEHAMAVLKASKRKQGAKEFLAFVLSDEGSAMLVRHGYRRP